MDNIQTYFFNVNIGVVHTGVESSSLLRSKFFYNQFKIAPIFITYVYKSQLITEVDILKAQEKLPKASIVFSIYDYFQQFSSSEKLYKNEVTINGEVVPHENKDNLKYLDAEGRLKAYVIYNRLNNKLHYINHFDNGIKRRRDYYHENGSLSCSQMLSIEIKDRIYQEIFYRYDRKICLIKEYFYSDSGKREKTRCQVFDNYGCFIGFMSDLEFTFYFLDQYFNEKREDSIFKPSMKGKESSILLIDKNKFFYEPVLMLKKNSIKGRFKLITAIHNLHAINYQKKETSRININYAPIFEDISQPDAVIVQTNIQKNDIIERFGDTNNIYAIPHTYDSPLKNGEEEITRTPHKAIYFARYNHDKKHELAIEAFTKVVEVLPQAELHCYGSGSRLSELQEMVKRLGMTKNIFLHGWCDNVAVEYESATLSVISSPSESFSLTIAESLAHGCPVVGFDVPYGPKELIESDKNGYLVPYGDIEMMADKILLIMEDLNLQRRLSERAREAAERYSEVMVKELWERIFQDIKNRNDH